MHDLPDALLIEPEQAVKSGRTPPYKVSTAFYNAARQYPDALPRALTSKNFLSPIFDFTADQPGLSLEKPKQTVIQGGPQSALAILEQLNACTDYQNTRNFPALDATSKPSSSENSIPTAGIFIDGCRNLKRFHRKTFINGTINTERLC